MADSTTPKRRTSRGLETRKKVEQAAAKLFVERGYRGTSMQDVADAAGVHVQTVYLAYGNKVTLLHQAASRLVAEGDDPSVHPSQRRWVKELVAEEDPVEKLRLYVRHVRHATQLWAPIRDVMREARDEPEVVETLAAMEEGAYQGPVNLWPAIHEKGQFREGMTVKEASILTYAIASPDTFTRLRSRGMSWKAAEEAIVDILVRTLLR